MTPTALTQSLPPPPGFQGPSGLPLAPPHPGVVGRPLELLVNRFPIQTAGASVSQYLVTFPFEQQQQQQQKEREQEQQEGQEQEQEQGADQGDGGRVERGDGDGDAEQGRGRKEQQASGRSSRSAASSRRRQMSVEEREQLVQRLADQQGWREGSWVFDGGSGMLFANVKDLLPEERKEWRMAGGAPVKPGGLTDATAAVVATQLHARFTLPSSSNSSAAAAGGASSTAGPEQGPAQVLRLLIRYALKLAAPTAVYSGSGRGAAEGGGDTTALLGPDEQGRGGPGRGRGGEGPGRGGAGGGRGGSGGSLGGLQVGRSWQRGKYGSGCVYICKWQSNCRGEGIACCLWNNTQLCCLQYARNGQTRLTSHDF